MATLTIKGDIKYLEIIKKENRLRASKYSLQFDLQNEEPKEKAKRTRKPKKKQEE